MNELPARRVYLRESLITKKDETDGGKTGHLAIPLSASSFHPFVHLVPDHLLSFLETLRVLPHRHRRRRLVVRLDRTSTGRHLCRTPRDVTASVSGAETAWLSVTRAPL